MKKAQALKVVRKRLSALRDDDENARRHGAENLAAIEGSLKRFGQVEPLVVQKSTGKVIGGNGRLTAMRKLGWTHASVAELDLDDRQAKALGVALNRTAELAEWDEARLHAALVDLAQDADGVADIGFDEDALEELARSVHVGAHERRPAGDGEPADVAPDEIECPRCKFKWNEEA